MMTISKTPAAISTEAPIENATYTTGPTCSHFNHKTNHVYDKPINLGHTPHDTCKSLQLQENGQNKDLNQQTQQQSEGRHYAVYLL